MSKVLICCTQCTCHMYLQSYLDFMLAVFFVGAIITFFMLPYTWFMETIGFLATFIEAMLGTFWFQSIEAIVDFQILIQCFFSPKGAPQFIRNFKSKSTQGMSIMMVVLWTVGDIFKTCYYKFRNAPPQFWACGLLQVSWNEFPESWVLQQTHLFSHVFTLFFCECRSA